MKKVLSFVLVVLLVVSTIPTGLLSVIVKAETSTSGTTGDCSWSLEDGVLTIYGNGAMENYSDSSSVPWGTNISKVIIESGVTSIGDYAFSMCSDLTIITIPDGLANIGYRSFEECSSLRSIVIPNSVKSIEPYSFRNCSNLVNITIPDTALSIGGAAFYNTAYYNKESSWEKGALYIGNHLVATNNNIPSMYEVKNGTKSIAGYAFCERNSITDVVIPLSVTNIGHDFFWSCHKDSEIWYEGSEEDRKSILIVSDDDNLILEEVKWHYNICSSDVHAYYGECDISCSNCEWIRSVEIGHRYEWIIDKENNCGVDGEKHEECSVCHATRSEDTVIAATGNHSWDNVCDASCNACDFTRAAPHDFEWVIDKQETCGETGIKHKECTVCHTKCSENIVIAASGNHAYDNTCDSECNVCTYKRIPSPHETKYLELTTYGSYSFKQSSSGNYYYATNYKNDSSSTAKLTIYTDCTVTIEYYTNTEEYDALVFKFNGEYYASASGNTPWRSMTLDVKAGDIITISYVKDHYNWEPGYQDDAYFRIVNPFVGKVLTENIEPTCEDAAVCTVCGMVVKEAIGHIYDNACDANCNTCDKFRVVPEHVYDDVCDAQCNVCTFIRVAPHNFKWIIDQENNCGVDGYKHEECSVCHVTRSENTVIDATGNHSWDNNCDTNCNVCGNIRTIEHIYRDECDRDCNVCGEFRKAPHKYDNDCDDTCNLCGSEREIGDHRYTNACDAFCNSCGFERTPSAHVYDNNCDKSCNVCEENRTVPSHIYDNACDAFCNECNAQRDVPEHVYSSGCDIECNECKKSRVNTEAHTYTNNCDADCNLCSEVRIPDEHKYINSCDTDCNVCGHIRTIEHTFTNECDGECNICFETRKIPHKYVSACDTDCDLCGKSRIADTHSFDNLCDSQCNLCGATRTITHDYENATCVEPKTCIVCGDTEGVALGHDYADATCTAPKTCSVCGTTSGNKLSHKYDSGKVTKKATCKATGVKIYTCSVCKGTKTETIAKLTTHTYSNNCDKSCNVCGKTRAVGAHKYSNNCDTTCNYCSAKRTIKHTYSNNCDTSCNVCKATRTITHSYKTTTTKATLTKNGNIVKKCTVCGKVASKSTIKYVKSFKLSTTTYTYDGKVKTPSVSVKDSAGKTLKKNTDYTVTYASGRKNVGTYKVTIKMKGKYSGTKTLTFKINPAKTMVSKLTAGKKSITVAITKKSTQVTGYQIQYSTSKSFSKATTKTISSYKTTKYTLKSLSTKKTYYVRVRTYKTVGKTKYYSGWSTYKYVKTK